jgi:HEAT repeats
MTGPIPDAEAPFPDLLGRLLHLLREQPEREGEVQKVVDLLASRVSRHEVLIEAGIENSWAVDGDPLKERLQARQVDAIRIAPGAGTVELLALGRALAADDAPIPSTQSVRVKLLPDPLPLLRSGPREALAAPQGATPLPRVRGGDHLTSMVEGILRELEKAIGRQQWLAALHDAQAAIRFLPSVREDARRGFALAIRRLLTAPVVEAFIEQAYRIPEEQGRTSEVLRLGGLPAAERMLEILAQSETIGPRAFLLDAIGGMPEASPLVVPLLRSPRTSDVRLAAELLGRLRSSEALKDLAPLAAHPEERTRLAVIDALARFRDKAALEPLRRALSHPSSVTRAHAGQALAARGSGAIAMPLLAALEAEKDHATWEELLSALAAINAPESVAALTRVALEKPGIFWFGKARVRRQLAIIRSLAAAKTPAARQALERIAVEGSEEVRLAAREALTSS